MSERDEAHEARDGAAGDDRETAYDLLQRGQALLDRRHFAQAAIVLERADRQEPAKGSILEALGRAYFNSGQTERARSTFEALLDIEPSSHYAHYAIGQSLKRLGRTDQARTHLRLAVALSPNNALYSGALARLGPKDEPAVPDATTGDAAP
jgi:tetratricopeptide (TPR) repeat protein